MNLTLRGGYDIFGAAGIHAEMPLAQPVVDRVERRPDRAQARRARNAAVLTRFWHEVEQYRRVPLREVST
jgi:hypothetical protein